jgi:hypothetical protein
MHPGWVRTDMGGANATLAKAESISSMLKVIEHLTIESTGKFFNYDGEELPWSCLGQKLMASLTY